MDLLGGSWRGANKGLPPLHQKGGRQRGPVWASILVRVGSTGRISDRSRERKDEGGTFA